MEVFSDGKAIPWSEAIKQFNQNQARQIEEQRAYAARFTELTEPPPDRYVELVRSGRIGHPGKTLKEQGK